MDRITEVTKDCFNALLQLRSADDASLPDPETTHTRLRGFVDQLLDKAAAAGFGREEAQEIAYPVVALADEIALSSPSERLRIMWSTQPLQIHYFQENVAGEAFFTRLDALKRDPRRAEILKAYYLALLFGFQGRYRVRGGELELMGITDSLARELSRQLGDLETLSPSGERPNDSIRTGAAARPVIWISAAAVVLAAIFYVGLRFSLSSGTDGVQQRITAAAAQ